MGREDEEVVVRAGEVVGTNANIVLGWCWKQGFQPFEIRDEEAEEDCGRIRRWRTDGRAGDGGSWMFK